MSDVAQNVGGLSSSEVAERKARGEVNVPPPSPGRSDLFNWRQKLSGLQPLSFQDAGRDRS